MAIRAAVMEKRIVLEFAKRMRDVTEVECRAREPKMKDGSRGGGDRGLGRGRGCLVDREGQPRMKIERIHSSGRLLYTILATRLVEDFFTLA